jgi:hypothetical protein
MNIFIGTGVFLIIAIVVYSIIEYFTNRCNEHSVKPICCTEEYQARLHELDELVSKKPRLGKLHALLTAIRQYEAQMQHAKTINKRLGFPVLKKKTIIKK